MTESWKMERGWTPLQHRTVQTPVFTTIWNFYKEEKIRVVNMSVRPGLVSVRLCQLGLSSVRLALGLPQGKLGVTFAYVVDMSHSKLAPRMHEHAPRLIRRRL